MRLAIISDIHSNLPALEAVLADLETQAVDRIIVAGDAINGGVFPTEVLDIIYTEQWEMVRGNHEQYLIDFADCPSDFPLPQWGPVHWTSKHLRPTDIDFLRNLPVSIEVEDLLIMHGALHDLSGGFFPGDSDNELNERYGQVPHKIIANGHTHLPIVCHWRDKILVNVGSVGLPLDGMPLPVYAILTQNGQQWIIQHRRVDYDATRVVPAFHERGFMAEGGILAELFLCEIQTGRIHVTPYLRRLFPYMRQHKLDFEAGVAQLGAVAIQPDMTYGTPAWR